MYDTGLFDSLEQDARAFQDDVDALNEGFNQEVAKLDIFNDELKRQRTAEAQEDLDVMIGRKAEDYKRLATGKISRARAYIYNAVSSPNTERLSTFKAVVEASGGSVTKDELELLLSSASGDFWTLKYLSGLEQKQTDTLSAAGIMSLHIPSPDMGKYLQILDEAEREQAAFYAGYKGSNPVGADVEQVAQIIFLNGLPHHRWADEFNAICPYFIGDRLIMRGTFDLQDELRLNEILGNTPRYGHDALKERIAEKIEGDSGMEALFWRSKYADVLEEVLNEKSERRQEEYRRKILSEEIKKADAERARLRKKSYKCFSNANLM
jgi:hypothetical protein